MVIAPNSPTGLPTLIPEAARPESKPQSPDPRTIVVQVLQGGKVLINQNECGWDALGVRLADIFKERADKVAFVQGAEEVSFAQVTRAIDIMRGAGIDHVGLILAQASARKRTLDR